jgi:hypothetical protein
MLNAATIENKRRNPRHRVLKVGKIVFGNWAGGVDVTIRDMSAGGARVQIPATADLPETLGLLVVNEGLLYPAVVRWRSSGMMGLEFAGQPRHSLRKI